MNVGTKLATPERRKAVELPADSVRRVIAVLCLIGIALIHLIDVPGKIDEVPYLGALFIGLIVASLLLAEAFIRHDDAMIWMASGLLAAATLAGYTVSRTVGLPGEGRAEVGNWSEPLGIASLVTEACLVWLVVARLMRRPTT